MITNKALGELADWAQSALQGNREDADGHLRHFYHIGASLLASPEFQRRWQQDFNTRLDSEHLECVCKFLETIARIEADQLEVSGAPGSNAAAGAAPRMTARQALAA